MADVQVFQNPKAENVKLRQENIALARENNELRAALAQLRGEPVETVAKVIPIAAKQAPQGAAPVVHQKAKQFQQGRAQPQMAARPQQVAQGPQVRRPPIQVTMENGAPQIAQAQAPMTNRAEAAMAAAMSGQPIQNGACSVVVGKLPPGAGRVPGTAKIMPATQAAPPQHVLPPDVERELAQSMAVEEDEGAKRFAQIELT